MQEILILKTGALGDVLRTTSILPGLRRRFPSARITWLTASGAIDLVRTHPEVASVVGVDPKSAEDLGRVTRELGTRPWDWILSFDDEEPLCRLASALPTKKLSGAHCDAAGRRVYSADVAAWFDMGLLSVHGKQRADAMKVENQRSHPQIFAAMLGIEMGKPRLELPAQELTRAEAFARERRLQAGGTLVGLNTGAGGRWHSKTLSPERTVELALAIRRELDGRAQFLLFGGPGEVERNARIVDLAHGRLPLVDAGCDNALLDFAALISLCGLLVSSDSLALHIALARDVRVVAFFAPTSAAEIETYGLGAKVSSTAPDYCSYQADADTSTLTTARLLCAVKEQLLARKPV